MYSIYCIKDLLNSNRAINKQIAHAYFAPLQYVII